MNRPESKHQQIKQLSDKDGCLLFGGMAVTELADRAKMTPFYAYDRSFVAQRIQQLREALPASVKIYYAVKANPALALLDFIAPLVDGFDVASKGEIEHTFKVKAKKIPLSFAGPGKRLDEVELAIRNGVLISVESEHEFDVIDALAQTLQLQPRIALRINPPFSLKASGMKMGGGSSPFGMDAERVPALIKRLNQLDVRLEGFHIYVGSQCLDSDAIVDMHTKSLALMCELAQLSTDEITWFNIGGGLGIPYFLGDTSVDLRHITDNLNSLSFKLEQQYPGAQLVIELGRYIVGEAGIYVCRVVDKKESYGKNFLVTDGGLHHHLAASGNFGQVIRRNYPVVIGNRFNTTEQELVTVVGPLCTPIDILADNVELSSAQIGDFFVVFQSGAYGLTASPVGFLNHPGPAEIFI